MKVVILAGGFGTRISEESVYKPKPLIDIGGFPILWHIMKYYSLFGHTDFIICGGYKQDCIKQYFSNYFLNNSDVSFDLVNNKVTVHRTNAEPWTVTVVDTGLHTMTGGRVKRIKEYLNDEPFMLTYGDGVSDVDLHKLLDHHKSSGKLVTITAVMPGGRFGALNIDKTDTINSFEEKRKEDGGWINGGFMVLNPGALDYIDGDHQMLEKEPFEKMVANHLLGAYKHDGFWQCMDTQRDKQYLESLWQQGEAPWKVW